jgi:signal transduction histidine kinase
VVTGVLAVVAVVALFAYTAPLGVEFADGDALGVVVVLAMTTPVLYRRRWPTAVGLATAVGVLALTVWDYAMPTAAVVIIVAVYSAGNYARLGRSVAVAVAHIVASVAYTLATSARHPEQASLDGVNIALNVVVLAGAWGVGRAVRNRRLYTAELEDRARRLEAAGQAEVRAALAEERSRIARELHDVVAHHVSVMTVQAAGARRALSRDPARSDAALRAIEDTGRSAV